MINKVIKWIVAAGIASTLLSPTIVSVATPTKDSDDVVCLAQNIYHEARGEPLLGRKAVAKVTLNRLDSGKFADSICNVVYQPGQFSWTTDKRKRIVDWEAWYDSLAIARSAIQHGVHGLENFHAMYFHSITIKPNWKRKVYAKIGKHIFYV